MRVRVAGVGLLMVLSGAASAAAQQVPPRPVTPPAPTTAPPAAGQPAPNPNAPQVPATRKFTGDAGVMFSLIKPDKTTDFESVMARVKEALGKSPDPRRKEQAQSWRVLKAIEPGPGGNVLYVWWIDPPAKDVDYVISTILAEAFPSEVQDLWAKYTACFVNGQTMLNLTQTLNMSPNAIK